MKEKFLKLKEENPDYSLDQLLYHTYQSLGTDLPFEQIKIDILNDLEIDEMEYYLKGVNTKLLEYVEKHVWPYWEFNDKGHGPIHRMEVTRRVFALNETFHLELEGFGGSPVVFDARLSVFDSPNSAGVVIDAIRYLKVARELGITGSLHGASAFTQKTPPFPMTFEDAQYECHKLANRELTELTKKQVRK